MYAQQKAEKSNKKVTKKTNMEKHSNIFTVIITTLILLIMHPNYNVAQLRHDYYRDSCPNVGSIVHSAVKKMFHETSVTGPATLRLFFHDCFVHGCDASVLIDSSPNGKAEKDAPGDLTLADAGFDTVIRAKAAVDAVSGCTHKVSCADILALATRDVVHLSGGPHYGVELGRKDGRASRKASVKGHLPLADYNYKQLKAMFASHGLSQVDLIALSGAHTIGYSHCNQFSKRIYNYNSQSSIDPTLHQGYAKELQQMCPRHADTRVAVALDPTTPLRFDNAFYINLLQGKALLSSDQALLSTRKSKRVVHAFATNNTLFEHLFVAAITRLGRVGIKTDRNGEVRRDCRFPN